MQSQAQDILKSLILLPSPISSQKCYADIGSLQNLAADLSVCLFQSLSPTSTLVTNGPGRNYIEALLTVGYLSEQSCLNSADSPEQQHTMKDEHDTISSPSKWPGILNQSAIFSQEKNEETIKLRMMLCESFIAVFLALIVTSLNTCNCHLLYRLVGQKFSRESWVSSGLNVILYFT